MLPVGLVEVTPPTVEPVTTAEQKSQSYVTVSTDDTYIDGLVKAARRWCENFTNRSLINTTWDYSFPTFQYRQGGQYPQLQNGYEIILPRAPLSSVTSITYIDADGVSQTLSTSVYQVSTAAEPGRIMPKYGQTYPAVRAQTYAGVTVRFVAGYGSAATSVPQEFKLAIMLLADHWYNNRAAVLTSTISKEIELGVRNLIWPYRVGVFS